MKKLYPRLFFFIALTAMISSSCQKEISIDLNSASSQIVIEGYITDYKVFQFVKLSQTVNYDQLDTFPPIYDALVTITDSLTNRIDTLTLDSTLGSYSNFKNIDKLAGIPGHTYILRVKVNDIEYKSTSTMPMPVNIDSVYLIKETGHGGFGNHGDEGDNYRIQISFNDPKGIENYYQFYAYVNSNIVSSISVMNDKFRDGKTITRDFRVDSTFNPLKKNNISIQLLSIDKATYDYYRTFRNVAGRGGIGFFSASPSNPISNISNGALGYFSAYSLSRKEITAP